MIRALEQIEQWTAAPYYSFALGVPASARPASNAVECRGHKCPSRNHSIT
jgi:hypothetical protein